MKNKQLNPALWNIEELLKAYFIIPIYQRPYSWENEQVKTLLEDILENFDKELKTGQDNKKGYYIGNIMVTENQDEEKNNVVNYFDVVDGQQRITTISLILLAMHYFFITKIKDDTIKKTENFSIFSILKNGLWKTKGRQNQKFLRLIRTNNVQKNIFNKIFDTLWDIENSVSDISSFKELFNENGKNIFEKTIINNFSFIIDFFDTKILSESEDYFLDFVDYFLQNIFIISVTVNNNVNNVFSIFESINSKGKKLEEIDLIKSYVFSLLDKSDYEKYSNLWGELTIKTGDQLYKYIIIYIKSFIKYYSNEIKAYNFKVSIKKEMQTYFKTKDERETVIKFLEDLERKVIYYNQLFNNDFYSQINNKRIKFYFKIFQHMEYEHARVLFFRVLNDLYEKKIDENKTLFVFSRIIKFLVISMGILRRGSKENVSLFSNVMSSIYENGIDESKISKLLENEIFKNTLNNEENLKNNIISNDMYSNNKQLTVVLLSIYKSKINDGNLSGENKLLFSHDKAFNLIDTYNKSINIDHLLPRKPSKESVFNYYYEGGLLKLKEYEDFGNLNIADGMDYNVFENQVLNKIGNLDLKERDLNSFKSNDPANIDNVQFSKYKDINDRSIKIAEFIVNILLKNNDK